MSSTSTKYENISMHSEADDLHVEQIDDTFYLLIPSRFPPVPLFKRISGGNDDVTARVADLYNPRLREKKRLLGLVAEKPSRPLLGSRTGTMRRSPTRTRKEIGSLIASCPALRCRSTSRRLWRSRLRSASGS